jgi:HAD superfamily 5'-nucleotidase-like hydrolase
MGVGCVRAGLARTLAPLDQLFLPLEELHPGPPAPGIARPRRIFCNRDLRLSRIAWVGFDMDYTLAIYRQAEMDELSVRATVEKLAQRGYPDFIRSIPYSTTFPVRGLLIDKRFGNILKMNRYKFVTKGYHGLRELLPDELRELYHAKKIRPATPRFHWIDTLYALSEATLYAALISAMEERNLEIDYARAFTDIREGIDEAHRDGTILEAVAADFPRFVDKDRELAQTLHKLRSAGKKVFLLTNSRWAYTNKMMSYLLDGEMGEYHNWRNYFDVVIVAATKPAFFQEQRPLMERVGDALRPAVLPLERGKIYEGGNLVDLESALGAAGDEVLYVGDHIYGDILRSKKESAWRTAMIIQELEGEVAAHDSCRTDFARALELEVVRDRLEDDLRFHQTRFKDLARRADGLRERSNGSGHSEPFAARVHIKQGIDRVRGRLRQVDLELRAIERRVDQRFHPYWGSLMKEQNEESIFGSQVEEYACLYTSRVSNFLSYSPQQYFRSPRDEMAHELG